MTDNEKETDRACENPIDEKGAAQFLGCSIATLQRDRHTNGNTPKVPYLKIGKLVRYEPATLRRVIARSRVGSVAVRESR